MQENKKNKKGGLLFAIFGVTVLIAAVAGSTYAYFQASATTTGTQIQGETLDATLGVTATRVSKGTGKLIPIYDGSVSEKPSQLSTAANSTNDCVDKNGYTVCQIYEVVVTNAGADATEVNIDVTLTGSPNIKWATMTDRTTVGTTYEKTSTSVATKQALPAKVGTTNGTITKYIMVYLNNTGGNQTADDGAESFSGTVKVTAATGEFIQAEF